MKDISMNIHGFAVQAVLSVMASFFVHNRSFTIGFLPLSRNTHEKFNIIYN